MNNKRADNIFSYGYLFVGGLELVSAIIVLIDLSVIISSKVNSGIFAMILLILNYLKIALFVGSIVMIVLSIKEKSIALKGYLIGLSGRFIVYLLPSSVSVFVQSILFLMAGYIIRKNNYINGKSYKEIRKNIDNTEWFYGNENK